MSAGLTPKLKGLDAHAEILTYATGKPDIVAMEKDGDMDSTLYRSAAEELQGAKGMGDGASLFEHRECCRLVEPHCPSSSLGLRVRRSTYGTFLPQQNLIL